MGCGTSVPSNQGGSFSGQNKSKRSFCRSKSVTYARKKKKSFLGSPCVNGSGTPSLCEANINCKNGPRDSSAFNPIGVKGSIDCKKCLENKCKTDHEDDDFDIFSSDGSCHDKPNGGPRLSLEGVPNFATFYNKPKECHFCGSPVVTHVCENCENCYFCISCMDERGNEHDKGHAISRLHESNGNDSRTFGAESSVGTLDCATNSLFFDPCSVCNRVILDTELVFHCEVCNFVECDNCHADMVSAHEHELKPFQRVSRAGNVTGSAVVSKTRNSDGNKVINDYVVVKLLGKGSYAKVKLVQHRRTRKLYALKILRRNRVNSTKRITMGKVGLDDDLLREVAVMKFVTHANIVKLNEVIDDTEAHKVYVIMEYCPGGPVHVLGDPPHPLEKVRQYGSDILSGLLHLHGEFLYHRDIKPANCLLSKEGVVKIADFGCCGSRLRSSYTDGTPAFNCPEQLCQSNVSGEIMDSWSFAMTLYQMAFGELAVNTTNRSELRQSLMSSEPFVMKADSDPQLCDLLSNMLDKNLSTRLMLVDAANHPFWGQRRFNSPPVNELASMSLSHADLCERALQSVQYGKKVSNYFYGVRRLRQVRRRLTLKHDVCNAERILDNDLGIGSTERDQAGEGTEKLTDDTTAAEPDGGATSPVDDKFSARDVVSLRISSMKKGVLDLSGLPFTVPPTVISSVAVRATGLTFSSNGLCTLKPFDFTPFAELQELTVTDNVLTEFPDEVLSIKKLRHLDLSFNRISNVSDRLPEAWRLEYLSLNSNLIRHVGLDMEGKSVFSGRCLRNVRLCDNPLESLPAALPTCPNLNLVVDDIPVLVEEWGKKVLEVAQNVVVVWNDIYPRLVGKDFPLYIASRSINLYKASIVDTLTIRHAVIWRTTTMLPLGAHSSEEMDKYLSNSALHSIPEKAKRRLELPRRVSIGAGSSLGALVNRAELPPIFYKNALQLMKSYFVVADSAEDNVGGFYPLVEYLVKCFHAKEKVLIFFDELRLPKVEREFIIGAMCQVMKRFSKSEVKGVSDCYEMILEATKSIYS